MNMSFIRQANASHLSDIVPPRLNDPGSVLTTPVGVVSNYTDASIETSDGSDGREALFERLPVFFPLNRGSVDENRLSHCPSVCWTLSI
jgi:hypothetical protein